MSREYDQPRRRGRDEWTTTAHGITTTTHVVTTTTSSHLPMRLIMMPPAGPILVRPREAARMLAISERTLWQLEQEGKLQSVRPGGPRANRMFRVRDLIAFSEALGCVDKRQQRG